MTVAVAVSTVAVVVRQLIRGNAIAHVVFVPWCDRKPRNGRPERSVLTDVARLAWVEQRWSRREGDGIWHQNDELLRHEPAHVAHRQPEAEPEEPEEQRVDLLQVISVPQLRSNDACWNFHHFDIQSTGYLERETRLIPPTVYSRLFEFPTTLITLSWLLSPFTRACCEPL